jgi:peptidoglycan/LPS O-acetylase OafA/YrhL
VLTTVVALALFDRLVALRWPNPVTFALRCGLGLNDIHVILIGVLVYKMRQAPRRIFALIGLFCLIPSLRFQSVSVESLKPAILTASFAIIVFLATTGRLRFLEWRPLVFLGTISYALYLNHEFMGYRIIFHTQRLGLSPSVSILLATLSALIVAIVITYRFEQPVTAALRRRLRDKPMPFALPGSARLGIHALASSRDQETRAIRPSLAQCQGSPG